MPGPRVQTQQQQWELDSALARLNAPWGVGFRNFRTGRPLGSGNQDVPCQLPLLLPCSPAVTSQTSLALVFHDNERGRLLVLLPFSHPRRSFLSDGLP